MNLKLRLFCTMILRFIYFATLSYVFSSDHKNYRSSRVLTSPNDSPSEEALLHKRKHHKHDKRFSDSLSQHSTEAAGFQTELLSSSVPPSASPSPNLVTNMQRL